MPGIAGRSSGVAVARAGAPQRAGPRRPTPAWRRASRVMVPVPLTAPGRPAASGAPLNGRSPAPRRPLPGEKRKALPVVTGAGGWPGPAPVCGPLALPAVVPARRRRPAAGRARGATAAAGAPGQAPVSTSVPWLWPAPRRACIGHRHSCSSLSDSPEPAACRNHPLRFSPWQWTPRRGTASVQGAPGGPANPAH